uniref:Ig-like domain-containing protein n=1 Tax=Oncorhynchus mykiss TaxID=8022 RepID=A0A8C7P4J9_ONCMY
MFFLTVCFSIFFLCPTGPVVALAGNDVILPCNFKPSISAVGTKVEWLRPDKSLTTVHIYEKQSGEEEQNDFYRVRTALFKELQKGNTLLKLTEVKLSDAGHYKCLIKQIPVDVKGLVQSKLHHQWCKVLK